MISVESLVQFVIYVIIAGVVYWLCNWLLDTCETPEPFRKVGKVVIAVVAVLVVITALLSLVGHPIVRF